MMDTASGIPSKLMSNTFDATTELYKANKFSAVKGLWTTDRANMLEAMNSIQGSMDIIKDKILDNISLLKPQQRAALEQLLDEGLERFNLRQQLLREDGQFLDDFWKLPKADRTPEAHIEARAHRQELSLNYRQEDSILSGRNFRSRKNYAKLYYDLPEEKLKSVDASNRALSAQDIANVVGANVDAVTTGITNVMAMQDKFYFIQYIKQSADAHPDLFKGFTEEKIGLAYDDILRGIAMKPELDIASQKILQQAEDIKQRLISLKMLKALTPDEERSIHGWIDGIAQQIDDMAYEKGVLKPEFKDYQKFRQESMDEAMKDYYKAFADYSNQNIIDFVGKHIYPYWTYHMYRWFWLTRTAIRRPGIVAAWGKYNNYSDYGYVHIPGTDLEVNPFVGSVSGATFGLARRDFKSYYESLGFAGEVLDFTMRRGFFPGIHFMLPIVMTPSFAGRPPELGETLPPLGKTAIESLIASNIPGVKDVATWLRDKVFHDNFRNYYTETYVSNIQAKSGGKLIGGQSGSDLGSKLRQGIKLTEEEQTIWDEASRQTAWMTILRSNFPVFRLRPQEFLEANEKATKLFQEYLGMSPEFQKDLWRHNLRPTDLVGGEPPDIRAALDQLWEWKLWWGRSAALAPPSVGDLMDRINKFWHTVEGYQMDRVTRQVDMDNGLLTPTAELHFSGREWREERAKNWNDYISKMDKLKTQPEYSEIPWTPEETVEYYKKTGFTMPVRGPIDEALELYFSIKLEMRKQPYSEEEDWDYLGFYLKREAVRQALTDEQRLEFDALVRKYDTKLDEKWRWIADKYLRGYWAVRRILIEEYSEDEKRLIAEFYADTTGMDRKDEIRAIVTPRGRKLISEWESVVTEARQRMRNVMPQLDFYLYVFGYISSPRTPEAEEMVRKWELDKSSLLR